MFSLQLRARLAARPSGRSLFIFSPFSPPLNTQYRTVRLPKATNGAQTEIPAQHRDDYRPLSNQWGSPVDKYALESRRLAELQQNLYQQTQGSSKRTLHRKFCRAISILSVIFTFGLITKQVSDINPELLTYRAYKRRCFGIVAIEILSPKLAIVQLEPCEPDEDFLRGWGKLRENVWLTQASIRSVKFRCQPLPPRHPDDLAIRVQFSDSGGGINNEFLRELAEGSKFVLWRSKTSCKPIFPPSCNHALQVGSGTDVATVVQTAHQHLSQSHSSAYAIQGSEKGKTLDIVWGVATDRELSAKVGSTDLHQAKLKDQIEEKNPLSGDNSWMNAETRAIRRELLALCEAYPAKIRLLFFGYETYTELEDVLSRAPLLLDGIVQDPVEQHPKIASDDQQLNSLRRLQVRCSISGSPESFRDIAWKTRTGSFYPEPDRRQGHSFGQVDR